MSVVTAQRLLRVAETDAHEGPVYAADEDALYFTTVRTDRVAIKRLALHLADRAEARERFEREARAISALSHPHVCTLFDVGAHDTGEFLVMELIDGETLEARLRRGPLSIAEALEYGAQMAEALAAAHEHGIVHRDLKPANVMLTRHGVKLLDFGLAAFRESINLADPALTKQGTIFGTLRYMAPERLQGKATDERVDIFALGTILHEMLTGRAAFAAENPAAVVAAVLERDPPSVSSQREAVPPALEWTIRRCLAKRVDARWQSAADLAGHLRWIAASASVVARERKNQPWRWVAIASVAGGVAIAGLAAALFWGARSPEPPTQAFRYEIPPPEGTEFERMFALSPDGRRIAFTATEPGGRRTMWIRPLDALASQSIPGTDGAFYPFWSPDARFIGFFADDELKKVELATGNIELISEAGLGGGGRGFH